MTIWQHDEPATYAPILLRGIGRFWHIADNRRAATIWSLLDKSGHAETSFSEPKKVNA